MPMREDCSLSERFSCQLQGVYYWPDGKTYRGMFQHGEPQLTRNITEMPRIAQPRVPAVIRAVPCHRDNRHRIEVSANSLQKDLEEAVSIPGADGTCCRCHARPGEL
eukprot:942758-Amphidinium_carterae.1